MNGQDFCQSPKTTHFWVIFGTFWTPPNPPELFLKNRDPALFLLYGSLRQAKNQLDGPVLMYCRRTEWTDEKSQIQRTLPSTSASVQKIQFLIAKQTHE